MHSLLLDVRLLARGSATSKYENPQMCRGLFLSHLDTVALMLHCFVDDQ